MEVLVFGLEAVSNSSGRRSYLVPSLTWKACPGNSRNRDVARGQPYVPPRYLPYLEQSTLASITLGLGLAQCTGKASSVWERGTKAFGMCGLFSTSSFSLCWFLKGKVQRSPLIADCNLEAALVVWSRLPSVICRGRHRLPFLFLSKLSIRLGSQATYNLGTPCSVQRLPSCPPFLILILLAVLFSFLTSCPSLALFTKSLTLPFFPLFSLSCCSFSFKLLSVRL